MKKMTLMAVEEYRKRYKDSTTVLLKTDGYVNHDGIQHIEVNFDDQFLPELGERLFVSIESLPQGLVRGDWAEGGDNFSKYIQERKDQAEGAKPSRKFR